MNYIIYGIVIILLVWGVWVFNALIKKRNTVKNAWADVDVQLKRRYDLVPNLVEAVKGYMGHEAGIFEAVTEARSRAMAIKNSNEKVRVENELTSTLKTLFAVSENYPQLRVNENFLSLQGELSNLENDLQSARRYYNAAVREFNNNITVFPQMLVAKLFGFEAEEFFGAEEAEKVVPKVGV
jgi:LemA protein